MTLDLPVWLSLVRFPPAFLAASLLLAALLLAAPSAQAGTNRFVRTDLDSGQAQVAPARAARIIRSTLDDSSHADFPRDDAGVRLIRVSLDEGHGAYAPLVSGSRAARPVRTSLD